MEIRKVTSRVNAPSSITEHSRRTTPTVRFFLERYRHLFFFTGDSDVLYANYIRCRNQEDEYAGKMERNR